MEVTPGYKQTEVGVIPEEWQVKALSSISPSQSVGLVINPSTYVDAAGTIPILVGSNVAENRIIWESARRITEESNRLLPSSRLSAGDLVTVRVGEPGVTAVVPPELDGCNCASMMIVRQHLSFDSHWLCYMMNSRLGRSQVEHVQYGTAQKQFNIGDAIYFSYPVPPLPEQRGIATALRDADHLINFLELLLVKKRQVKQGAMQELLIGKRRLPGFSGEWEVKPLSALAKIQRGASPRPIDSPAWFDDNSSIGWVRISDVTNARMYLVETTQRLSPRGVQNSRPVISGSLIMSICATVGRPIITNIDTCIHDGFVVFDNIQGDKYFLYYFLKSIEGDWSRSGQTGSQMNLNTGLINRTEIFLPPIEEQTAIAAVLSEMDMAIDELEDKLGKSRQIKQGMMQELLTGRIRLA